MKSSSPFWNKQDLKSFNFHLIDFPIRRKQLSHCVKSDQMRENTEKKKSEYGHFLGRVNNWLKLRFSIKSEYWQQRQ